MAQKDEQFREKVQSLDAAASHRVLRPATPEFAEVLRWSKMMGRVAIPLMLLGLLVTVGGFICMAGGLLITPAISGVIAEHPTRQSLQRSAAVSGLVLALCGFGVLSQILWIFIPGLYYQMDGVALDQGWGEINWDEGSYTVPPSANSQLACATLFLHHGLGVEDALLLALGYEDETNFTAPFRSGNMSWAECRADEKLEHLQAGWTSGSDFLKKLSWIQQEFYLASTWVLPALYLGSTCVLRVFYLSSTWVLPGF